MEEENVLQNGLGRRPINQQGFPWSREDAERNPTGVDLQIATENGSSGNRQHGRYTSGTNGTERETGVGVDLFRAQLSNTECGLLPDSRIYMLEGGS